MRIGILGGGQLARMLALAGYPLGLQFSFFDPSDASPAFPLGEVRCAQYELDQLREFARSVDVLTYEFENVPAELLSALENEVEIFPSPRALVTTRDRTLEKQLLNDLGIRTAPWKECGDIEAIRAALVEFGGSGILKTCTEGYDGKGQIRIKDRFDNTTEVEALLSKRCILEGFVRFEREVSLVAARGQNGTIRFYPLVENVHRDGILHITRAPYDSAELQNRAEDAMKRVLEGFDYVGVMAIEFFVMDGELIANEMAPRVHNTGHWTIEGAITSQFENHIRAVAGLPLGETDPLGSVAMVNVVGREPDAAAILEVKNAHLHLYGKSPRARRKLGHVTVVADSEQKREETLARLIGLCPFE